MNRRILSFALVLVMMFTFLPATNAAENVKIKNVIYLIPDGGGMSPYYLTDAVKRAGGWNDGVFPNATVSSEGAMAISPYLVGSFTTHCEDRDITDSAAAGTALSSGYRTKYGRVGVDSDYKPHANLLEAAQYNGKRTGMVTTYEWMNATPAAFGAHHSSRSTYPTLSEQIVNQGIDVVLGAGFGEAKWGSIADAEKRGYEIINTPDELKAVESGDKIWGNLIDRSFPYDIENEPGTPTLAEMTKAAITALDGSENGFFLMVEGSKVDGAGHQNYALGMVGDFLAFDEACKVALDYAKEREDTLVVVCPDHDTGGMNLPENLEDAVKKIQAGVEPEEITWESMEHTARRGGLFIYGPEGIAYPEGISGNDMGTQKAYDENIIDIPDIARYIEDMMGVDMDAITPELFVDVTDRGKYTSSTGLFKFNDSVYSAKVNSSYAYKGDEVVDLDGQVCLYVNKRFYVPQLLLDIMDGKKEAILTDIGSPVYSALKVEMAGTDITDWNGTFTVTNLLMEKEFNGKIEFTYPESFAKMDALEIKGLKGGETTVIEFKCPEIDVAEGGFSFKYQIIDENENAAGFTSKFEPAAYAAYTDTPITVDGVIGKDEWKDALVLKCDTIDAVVDIEGWKGTRDMSAVFSTMWDEENLYFYSVTTDEIFYTDAVTLPMRNLDSISLGMYDDVENFLVNGENARNLYEQIEVALIDGNSVAHRTRTQQYITAEKSSPEDEIIQDDEFAVKCVRDGDYLTYEMKISWRKLFGYEFSPNVNDIMGLAFVATDNDGGGKRGYVEYGSGMGGSRNVNAFAKLLMLDLNGKKSVSPEKITVLFNGEELAFDVAPTNYNGRAMVPFRAIAEKLGATMDWDNDTKTVMATIGDTTLEIPTDRAVKLPKNGWDFFFVKVNGVETIVDTGAQLIDDRTMVPLMVFEKVFGCTVEFDGATQTVSITK